MRAAEKRRRSSSRRATIIDLRIGLTYAYKRTIAEQIIAGKFDARDLGIVAHDDVILIVEKRTGAALRRRDVDELFDAVAAQARRCGIGWFDFEMFRDVLADAAGVDPERAMVAI